MGESGENGPRQNGSGEDLDALIFQWAPLLRLHPDEPYFPMDPSTFVKASRFRHHIESGRDKGYNKDTAKWVKTDSHDPAYYEIPINIINGFGLKNGQNRRPHDDNAGTWMQVFLQPKGRPRGNRKKSPTGRVPVFTQLAERKLWKRGGTTPTLIQYWWFFGYSDGFSKFRINHQGDWEHCTAVIQDGTLTGAFLAAHSGTTFYKASDLEWNQQCRFVVYVANESHASYARERSPLLHAHDHTKRGGMEWETWQLLGAVSDQPWANFAGAWGEVGEFAYSTGPLGPAHKSIKL